MPSGRSANKARNSVRFQVFLKRLGEPLLKAVEDQNIFSLQQRGRALKFFFQEQDLFKVFVNFIKLKQFRTETKFKSTDYNMKYLNGLEMQIKV